MAKRKKIKCAVIGGLGFLGSNLVDELNKLNYDIIIIDNKNIKQKGYFKCDVKDYHSLRKVLSGCDYVFNFAGIADIAESKLSPEKTIELNILGTTNVLNACVKNKVSRFIFASSMYVYSSFGSFYNATKKSSEIIIEAFNKEYGLDFTLLRYGSLYGPRAQDWNGINSFIKQIVNEGSS